jgi:hypothetical protein
MYAVRSHADYVDTFVRFKSLVSKDQYQQKRYEGPIAKPDLKNYQYGAHFKTRITEMVQTTGVNFAGQYCFVQWGCGSNCWMSCVVDMRTGRIYDGVEAAYGYEFNSASSYLLVNLPDEKDNWYYKNRVGGPPEEYVWKGNRFEMISPANK